MQHTFEIGDRVKVGPNPGTEADGSGYVAADAANAEGVVVDVGTAEDGEQILDVRYDDERGEPFAQWIHSAHLTKIEEA